MQPHPRWVCTFLLLTALGSQAQSQDSLRLPVDTLLTYADSLSIFNLIDSLLQIDNTIGSQLSARLGYNSNVLSAGRTLGIENFGLSPGLSYYHKSGLFTDLTAYWSADFDPKLYLFTLSGGYMHIYSEKFSLIGEFNKYFYVNHTENDYIPYSNSISISPYLEVKPVGFRLDYSFYFGEETAHRIMPGVSLRLAKKHFLKLDRVALYPGVSLMLGNEHFTELILLSTDAEIEDAIRRNVPWYELKDRNEFGVLNYAISLPLSLTLKNVNLYISYSYYIPKALPGEPFELDNSSFVSASFSWYFDLNHK